VTGPRAGRRIADPPSLTALAADELRAMILRGDLAPGDRVVENRLTAELGISRPPLREALRVLEHEGLVVQTPRRGASVRELTLQDIYEIVTLREDLEAMAVRLGVPVRDPALLAPLHEAVEILERQAAAGAEDTAVEDTVRFHRALVGLAGHGRVDEAYRALSLQLRVVMAMNRRARASSETLLQRAARHRRLVGLVEAGDPEAVLADLHGAGSRSFLAQLPAAWVEAASPSARAWYAARV
jgi:DNA-binding GntR family transcriptional regulator